jgi:hypothetical protein
VLFQSRAELLLWKDIRNPIAGWRGGDTPRRLFHQQSIGKGVEKLGQEQGGARARVVRRRKCQSRERKQPKGRNYQLSRFDLKADTQQSASAPAGDFLLMTFFFCLNIIEI